MSDFVMGFVANSLWKCEVNRGTGVKVIGLKTIGYIRIDIAESTVVGGEQCAVWVADFVFVA